MMESNSSDDDCVKLSERIPEGWEWVLEIINEAHLPLLALLVQLDTTKEKHTKIIYDPKSKTSRKLITNKTTVGKDIVGFITSTRGKILFPEQMNLQL